LSAIAAAPLPAVLVSNEFQRVHVISEIIELRPDGTGTRSTVREVEQLNREPATARTRISTEHELDYHVVRGQIRFAFECPPNAGCVAPPHLLGRATANGLRLTYPTQADVPLHFIRISLVPVGT
jgi:hypothetical protein